MAQQYETIKFADDLKASEFVANGDVSTAMPVEVWLRLPDRTVIDSEYANKVRFHDCSDEQCDERPSAHRRLHVDLTTDTRCPVHKAAVLIAELSNNDTATRLACPAGHGWRVLGHEGGPERLIPEAE